MLQNLIGKLARRQLLQREHQPETLACDELENRIMLSTVDVTVAGQRGEELFDVFINDQNVGTRQATTDFQTFRFNSQTPATEVRIQFKNDLYDPANGIDRNLIVDNINIDGTVIEAESPDVFGTGTWTGAAITPGFNQSEYIHANGYLQFQLSDSNGFSFQGFDWTRTATTSPNDVSLDNGVLSVSGGDTASSVVWAEADVSENRQYRFSVDAFREVLSGSIAFDGQPWATAGVDMFGANGQRLAKAELQLFGPTDPNGPTYRTRDFFAPAGTVSASVWVWAAQTDAEIPVRIREFTLEDLGNTDTTPPTLQLIVSDVTQATNRIGLTINGTDESGLIPVNEPGFDIRIDGPNGYSTQWNAIAGGPIPGGVGEFFEISGNFTSASNGEYFVTANAGRWSDPLGNRNPSELLGSFVIAIP